MMSRSGSRLWASVIGVVAVAAMLIGINLFADSRLATVQLDLTQGHLYTLSDGTRKIIAGLKQPITLRLYYSRALGSEIPLYGAYADRVREMLSEYAAISNGKLKIELYDPEPFSATEDRAIAQGMQGVPVDQGGEQVYFGVAGSNMLDDERNIPFFQTDRERFLEYDLTRLVYELSNPARPLVGVMSSLPIDGDPQAMMQAQGQGDAGKPWASMVQLRQSFDVKDVPLDTQMIDPAIKVLLVAQAQNLSDNALYAIDQFVMRGGRLMVMVDPRSEAEAAIPGPSGQPPTQTGSDLHKLFAAWGIDYDPKFVVGDLTGAWEVRGSASETVQAVPYVAWFNIRDGISHDDPATADLSQVSVASAGAIAKHKGAAIEFDPLLTSSDQSALLPVATVEDNPNPDKILANFKPSGGPRVIAARVRGVLKSAFTGPPAPPKDAKGNPTKPPADFPAYIAHTTGDANLVVVGDSDILADRFWVQTQDFFGQQQSVPFSDNGPFVANLIGTLSGNDALLGLRSRGASLRPFSVVDQMQQQAQARFRQTEQTLQAHLADTQKKLAALRGNGEPGAAGAATSAVITEQQRAAISELNREMVATRGQLRRVQLDLRRDISALEMQLRVLDIAAVPVLLVLLTIVLALVRRRRRARARA
jgi:ABC-type uncharacterized transport system involved in gliding motility auxiliary subunit